MLDVDDDSGVPAALADCLLPALQRSAVLQRLAALQSSLDLYDVEGLLALAGGFQNVQVELEDHVRFARLYRLGLGPDVPDWSAKDRLVAFLLAATFKDCSIIARLHLPPSTDPNDAATPSTDATCDHVKVIDLDSKPADRLSKWAKLDRDIVSHFAEHLERSGNSTIRRCCDG